MQQCFAELPNERPTFNEIKRRIEGSYSQLRRAPETVVEAATADEESLHYADLQFEVRFEDMKAKNRKHHGEKLDQTIRNSKVVLNARSLTASFTNEKEDYTTLQNAISSDKPAHLSVTGSNHPSLSNDEGTLLREYKKNRNYIPLSPGCIGHKRFISYGGEVPTSPLQPEKNSTCLMPAKSYPNPSYMMFPTDLNKNESRHYFNYEMEDKKIRDELKRLTSLK